MTGTAALPPATPAALAAMRTAAEATARSANAPAGSTESLAAQRLTLQLRKLPGKGLGLRFLGSPVGHRG